MRKVFVESTLSKLLKDGILSRDDSVLAVCAGTSERDLFYEMNFPNVLLTNIDERMHQDQFKPFSWQLEDAQHLSFSDASFDVAFVADGLHHCRSPHRALLEMYRVARKAVIVVESRDSIAMRLANRMGLTPEYELESVIDHGFAYEGVDNTPIPNFIYRWTESDFRKTLKSFDPTGKHTFRFFYALNLPYQMAALKKSRWKLWALYILTPLAKLIGLLFKHQCNSFAMVALKPLIPRDLWPWLKHENGAVSFDKEYARQHYKVS